MLYLINNVDSLGDEFSERVMLLLSEERREKVQRLHSKNGRLESIAAYMLLRLALHDIYGINEAVDFIYMDKGKPLLKDYPQIHFNISHTKGTAASVVSDHEVGVDVQSIRSVSDNTAKRVLTNDEYSKFKSAQNPFEYFCEVWAIKESYMKMTGQGIAAAFKKLPVDEIKNIHVFRENDYYCSVCSPFPQVFKIKHIRREDFEQLLN